MTDDEKAHKVNERRAVTRDKTTSKRSRGTIKPSNTDGVSVGRTTNYMPHTTNYNNSSMHGGSMNGATTDVGKVTKNLNIIASKRPPPMTMGYNNDGIDANR